MPGLLPGIYSHRQRAPEPPDGRFAAYGVMYAYK